MTVNTKLRLGMISKVQAELQKETEKTLKQEEEKNKINE
jgi:hypothetical protein